MSCSQPTLNPIRTPLLGVFEKVGSWPRPTNRKMVAIIHAIAAKRCTAVVPGQYAGLRAYDGPGFVPWRYEISFLAGTVVGIGIADSPSPRSPVRTRHSNAATSFAARPTAARAKDCPTHALYAKPERRHKLARAARPPTTGRRGQCNPPCQSLGRGHATTMRHMKPEKSGQSEAAPATRRPAKPEFDSPTPAAKSRAPATPGRVRPEEWRGTKRNASINDAIVVKFKVLSARGKTLAQIADKLGISIGRARNISAEIRLGKEVAGRGGRPRAAY